MLDQIFSYLDIMDNHLWNWIGFPFIVVLGLWLSWQSRFLQVRCFPTALKIFYALLQQRTASAKGVHPIKAFFACVGGCIGIGNIVGVCTAVQIGGPGAIFWVWVTALVGMILKYAELYLGMRYRVLRPDGGHNGGPMYFLPHAFKQAWVPTLVAVLLSIYGVEIFQFRVMTSSLSENFDLNHMAVTVVVLACVVLAVRGGIGLVGTISSWLIPLFFTLYFGMGLWVMAMNYQQIPQMFADIIYYAFTPHAAVGGFFGGIVVTISQGVRRACYSSDIGIGYASVIHSESSTQRAEMQASLAIVDIFLDAFLICSMSMFIILVTDHWQDPVDASYLVQTALSEYFPYMDYFMPIFLVLLGYSTVIAFYCVGIKAAEFLGGAKARRLYNILACTALFFFSFVSTQQALVVMSIAQLSLVVVNLLGIFRLRHEISYDVQVPEELGQAAVELRP